VGLLYLYSVYIASQSNLEHLNIDKQFMLEDAIAADFEARDKSKNNELSYNELYPEHPDSKFTNEEKKKIQTSHSDLKSVIRWVLGKGDKPDIKRRTSSVPQHTHANMVAAAPAVVITQPPVVTTQPPVVAAAVPVVAPQPPAAPAAAAAAVAASKADLLKIAQERGVPAALEAARVKGLADAKAAQDAADEAAEREKARLAAADRLAAAQANALNGLPSDIADVETASSGYTPFTSFGGSYSTYSKATFADQITNAKSESAVNTVKTAALSAHSQSLRDHVNNIKSYISGTNLTGWGESSVRRTLNGSQTAATAWRAGTDAANTYNTALTNHCAGKNRSVTDDTNPFDRICGNCASTPYNFIWKSSAGAESTSNVLGKGQDKKCHRPYTNLITNNLFGGGSALPKSLYRIRINTINGERDEGNIANNAEFGNSTNPGPWNLRPGAGIAQGNYLLHGEAGGGLLTFGSKDAATGVWAITNVPYKDMRTGVATFNDSNYTLAGDEYRIYAVNGNDLGTGMPSGFTGGKNDHLVGFGGIGFLHDNVANGLRVNLYDGRAGTTHRFKLRPSTTGGPSFSDFEKSNARTWKGYIARNDSVITGPTASGKYTETKACGAQQLDAWRFDCGTAHAAWSYKSLTFEKISNEFNNCTAATCDSATS
jgi:hypothetical protein